MAKGWSVAAMVCVAVAGATDGSAQVRDDAKAAAAVERGLLPAVMVVGRPAAARTMAAEMARLHVPGVSVAVMRDGRIVWAKGFGITRAGGAPVTPETLFQAASISKPVTALGALRLSERGTLPLDRDVNTVLKSNWLATPPGTAVTLRMLLSHTAGTTVHGFSGYAAGVPVPTVEQVLSGGSPANTGPVIVDTPPGTKWRYSGGGYTYVQKLIGDATGRPFASVLRDEVLVPARMTHSRFEQPLSPALLERAAWPHDGAGKPVAGGPHTYPELAAAGLWTTPGDLLRFMAVVRASAAGAPGALLSRPLATAMLTPGMGGYGLGFETAGPADNRHFAHGGSNEGYKNSVVAFSGTGDGVAVMTNGDQGGELTDEVLHALAAAFDWPAYRSIERASVPIEAGPRAALPGEYRLGELGTFSVLPGGETGLALSLTEGSSEPLYRMDADRYFILSRDLIVRFDGKGGGRIVSGPFDLPFERVPSSR